MEMKQEQVTIRKGYRQGSTTSTALWGYAGPIKIWPKAGELPLGCCGKEWDVLAFLLPVSAYGILKM